MQPEKITLLYCAYAIAVFDLLCAVLFAALSLFKIYSHVSSSRVSLTDYTLVSVLQLSWLTIFAVCFAMFWLTLIALLIYGIYSVSCS